MQKTFSGAQTVPATQQDDSVTIPSAETRREEFGKDIAFGMQQTLACWATDFIDPYVGEKIQHRFEDETHHMPKGSTWIGEIIGDSAAFFTFLGVQKFFPSLTRGLQHTVRKVAGQMLEKSGRKELKEWAREQHARPGSPEYREKMEEWKEFQSGNIAKSAIISGSSIALNVATQKAMKNTHTIPVIFLAKLAGATITVAGMIGMRFVIPKTTKTLDDELSHRYFSPAIRETQKLLGAEVDLKPKHHARREEKRRDHAEQVSSSRQRPGPQSL